VVLVSGVVAVFVLPQQVVVFLAVVIGVLQQVGTVTGVVFIVFTGHFGFLAQ